MATRRTWVWILVAVMVTGLVTVIGIAGAGIYFVSKRVQASRATPPEALRSFEQVTSSFEGRRALYEMTASHEPHLTAPLASLPTASTRANDLWVQAWDPEEERLVKLSLPLWLLRYGDKRMRVLRDEGGVDLRELTIDANELGRIGPAIVLDYRRPNGLRVLLWTQ
jgi:hypothetical protein